MAKSIKEQTCCFTGHRMIPKHHMEAVAVSTEVKIRELILKQGMRYFGVGGALGYDTMAADILFRLRDTDFPNIKVILVYPFEGFINRWTDKQKAAYAEMLPKYNKCVCVCSEGSREAFLTRDRHLVDCSSFCIAYCTRNQGGTAYTVRYAQHKGVPVFNTASDTFPGREVG